jgi:hypothetical protein
MQNGTVIDPLPCDASGGLYRYRDHAWAFCSDFCYDMQCDQPKNNLPRLETIETSSFSKAPK